MDLIIVRDETLRQRAVDLIARLDLAKPWEVTVKRYRKRRTTSQNALYWKWLTIAAEQIEDVTGYDKDEIHEFLKRKFLSPQLITIKGETVERYSTTKLTTVEMSQYCEHVARFCAELGIALPHPEDMHGR